MDRKKLEKLKREWEKLWNSQPKPRQLRGLAQKLGRIKVVRGKHPMWESERFPMLSPLSIPDHKGVDMAVGTARSILIQLDEDIGCWDAMISRAESSNGKDHP